MPKCLAIAVLALVLGAGSALSQPRTLPPNTVVGRLGIGPGPAQAIPFLQLFNIGLGSPPPIGGTTPNAGHFNTLSVTGQITTGITGLVQCLHVNSTGVMSGTGVDCGSGGGGGSLTVGSSGISGGVNGNLLYDNAGILGEKTFSSFLTSPPPIGGVAPNTGAFSTLSVSTSVSGGGFANLFAVPPPIGSSVANSGSFTSLAVSSSASGTGFNSLFASPPPIGTVAQASGEFTTLAASGAVTGAGFTARLATPGPIGSTVASSGAFTTLAASSTVSGTGFSTYLASPPGIGSGTPSTGSFTTLAASGAVSGAGINGIFSSPPAAIGTGTPVAGTFAALTATGTLTTNVTGGGVKCLHVDNAGVVSGTAGDCTVSAGANLTANTSSIDTSANVPGTAPFSILINKAGIIEVNTFASMLNTAPPDIGTTTPGKGGFTTLDTTGLYTATNIVAPATPAAGRTNIYVDSTQKVLSSKSDAGTVSNTVVPLTATANNYVTGIGAAGVITRARPVCADLSDAAATCSSALLSATTGNLPVSRLNSGTGAGGTTFWRGDGTWAAPTFSSGASTNQIYPASGAIRNSLNDQLYIAGATLGNNITSTASTGNDWLSQFTATVPGSWTSMIGGANLAVEINDSPANSFAIIGAAHSAHASSSAQTNIAITAFGVADDTIGSSIWGFYAECHRVHSNSGGCAAMELDVREAGSQSVVYPISNNLGTIGINNACGAGVADTGLHCSMAMLIAANPQSFVTGIVFGPNSITAGGGVGSNTTAILLQEDYLIGWLNGNSISGAIYTDTSHNLNFISTTGVLKINGNSSVNCSPGSPSSSFQVVSGLVVHC